LNGRVCAYPLRLSVNREWRAPQRLVRRVVVVPGRQHLPAEPDAAVDEAEPLRRRVGEREVGRVELEVGRGGLTDPRLGDDLLGVQVLDRVAVQPLAEPLDRRPHRLGMRRQQERREVAQLRVERERRLDGGPVARVELRGARARGGLGLVVAAHAAAERGRARAGGGQQLPSAESTFSHQCCFSTRSAVSGSR
jgi:hypothetical protein